MRGIKKRRENSTDGKRVCIEDKPTPIEIVAQLTLLEVMNFWWNANTNSHAHVCTMRMAQI